MPSIKGFTIIELLVAIAMIAILVSVAVPGFSSLLRSNELRGNLSSLNTSIALARSHAISRKVQVSLCSSTDGVSCAGSANWTTGWIIFSDLDSNGELTIADCNPTSDCLLKVQEAPSGQTTLTAVADVGSSSNWLAYDRLGERNSNGVNALRICAGNAEATNDTDKSHTLNISLSGSTRISKGASACP